MNGLSDQELLREYVASRNVATRSEAAFAELVRRHVDLVHSAAIRMVGDAHLAQDISQGVFAVLARSAPKLTGHPVLCGWLHRTTRNLASKAVRSDVIRRAREQEAAAMNELLSPEPDAPWEQVAPHLDAALDELTESDRNALMLRYFQGKSAREMAQVLGGSEEAAQKRVNRAVERLRRYFSKRGVAAGAGGLVVVISANAVQAAPAGLAGAISSAVLAGGACHATTTLAAKVLAMTTIQKAAISIITAVALGAGLYQAHQISTLRRDVLALNAQQAAMLQELRQTQREGDAAKAKLAAANLENSRLKANQPVGEVLRGRGEVARWRSVATDPETAAIKTSLEKVERLKQRLEQTPEAKIPELALLTDKDWFNMAKGNLISPDDYRWAFAGLRRAAQQAFAPLLQGAMRGYLYANRGEHPTNLAQIVPFCKPPVDPALVDGWKIVRGEDDGNGTDLTVTQKTAVDKEREARVFLTPVGNCWTSWSSPESVKASQ